MTTALWCVFVASMLPYVLATLSKVGRPYDNAKPRAGGHSGWQQRADWAQANAWEAFAPFAAAFRCKPGDPMVNPKRVEIW